MEYKEVYLPSHHRAKQNGCVYEHIIVAEKMLGCELFDNEVVHHKNRDKTNNSPDNLMVFTSNNAHIIFHKGGKLITLDDGTYDCISNINYYCKICGKELKRKGSQMCFSCKCKQQRKVQWPDKKELISLLETKSYVQIGKLYGVSDNAVRKWCKYYNII